MSKETVKKKYRDFDDMLKEFNKSNELNKPSQEETERQRKALNQALDDIDSGLRIRKKCNCQ